MRNSTFERNVALDMIFSPQLDSSHFYEGCQFFITDAIGFNLDFFDLEQFYVKNNRKHASPSIGSSTQYDRVTLP